MKSDGKRISLCSARPEFVDLSEDDIWEAMAGDDYGENPITCEVTRLGAEFVARFKAYADEHRPAPAEVLRVDAHCPIERVAIVTILRYVEECRASTPVH